MGYQESQFETRDTVGTTTHFNGTVGTSATAVPGSATTVISELRVVCPIDQEDGKHLLVSFDSGTTFIDLYRGGFLDWTPKGDKRQIHIKGSKANTKYQIVMNREVD